MAINEKGQTTLPLYDYDTAIRARTESIDAIGSSATDYAQAAAQRRLSAAQATQNAAINAAGPTSHDGLKGVGPSSGSGTMGTVGPVGYDTHAKGNNVASFMSAISGQESGNYSARNKDSGAMGKYQIMPGNLGGTHSGWDWEAMHKDVTVNEFMHSPQIQEQIAQYKLKGYYNKYGPAGAAVAWYAGPGMVSSYLRGGGGGGQGGYPTINAYVNSILRRMGLR